MLIFNYRSKLELLKSIGNYLDYTETSMFGLEYESNGELLGCNRPTITGIRGREFFAMVTMKDDRISHVK
jgi:hypothetical protein